MTSLDEGLAGETRESAEHGLPSLVIGVRDLNAPSRLKSWGGDEILLDRMRAKHRKGSGERKAKNLRKTAAACGFVRRLS